MLRTQARWFGAAVAVAKWSIIAGAVLACQPEGGADGTTARSATGAIRDSLAKATARSQERRRAQEAQVAALPQPFARLLLSMYRGEPQLGTDGKQHKLDLGTGVTMADGLYLYNLTLQVKPRRIAEVGVGQGFSTMFLLAALHANQHGSYVGMDPFEYSLWNGAAVQKAKEAGMASRFRFLTEYSTYALPQLRAEKDSFDLIFIDGDHKFDSVLTDFILANGVCAASCHVVLHDPWMKSVSKAVRFIENNRADYARRPVPAGVNMVAFQKVGLDTRPWTHFTDF